MEIHILTKRTLEDPEIAGEVKKIHPAVKLEYKILSIVLRHQSNLKKLIKKKRSHKNKPSKKLEPGRD